MPAGAVQLLPGRGETVGAQLVASPWRARRHVHRLDRRGAHDQARTLADRLDDDGHTIPLIAETGGQNAMVASTRRRWPNKWCSTCSAPHSIRPASAVIPRCVCCACRKTMPSTS